MKEKNLKLILGGTILAILIIIAAFAVAAVVVIPGYIETLFGQPNPEFDNANRILYSARLFLNRDFLLSARLSSADNRLFMVKPGETASDVAVNLEKAALIDNLEIFKDYLVYKGIDTVIQSGAYSFSPAMKPVEIAAALYDENPLDVAFSILPGWRSEEIAELLPTSGLEISVTEFLNLVHNPSKTLASSIPHEIETLDGFLLPGNYQVLKTTNAEGLIRLFADNFMNQMPVDYESSLARTGLSLKQTVILASIIEKETIIGAEAPIIASVFLNRLMADIPLQSDPTVQFALGYDNEQDTWWKNPLNQADLSVNSPFNTYSYPGMPPAAICNPGKTAIISALDPADTDFLFFRSACDGSGRHVFSRTYAEHLSAACE